MREREPMGLFPMFVKLAGRHCLVVGAGAVGESKIESLLAAGADVRVIARSATKKVREWARAGRIEWKPRSFVAKDLEGMFLVVAATSSPELHEKVYREAHRRGVLCNAVDEPERCDFYYPAVVRRGELQIAISTGGRSPALAQRLRKELEQQFGPEYERWLAELGETRKKLFEKKGDRGRRKRWLHRLASQEAFRAFRRRSRTDERRHSS